MSRPTRFVYSETTRPQWWVLALVWGCCLLPFLGVTGELLASVSSGGWRAVMNAEGFAYMAVDGTLILTPILFHLLFGKFMVGVSDDRAEVVASFGVGWIHKHIGLVQIAGASSTEYRPLREFGGWGIRGMGDKKAWTMRGNQAVVLELEDGGELYLGSETPDRLQEHIEAAIERHSANSAAAAT